MPDCVVINPVQDPHAAVTTAQTNQPVYMWVLKHLTEVGNSLCIRTGQVLVFVQGVLCQYNPEAKFLQDANSLGNAFGVKGGACRGNNTKC